jgi:hypothetical protein
MIDGIGNTCYSIANARAHFETTMSNPSLQLSGRAPHLGILSSNCQRSGPETFHCHTLHIDQQHGLDTFCRSLRKPSTSKWAFLNLSQGFLTSQLQGSFTDRIVISIRHGSQEPVPKTMRHSCTEGTDLWVVSTGTRSLH